jgi:hypothetical protein
MIKQEIPLPHLKLARVSLCNHHVPHCRPHYRLGVKPLGGKPFDIYHRSYKFFKKKQRGESRLVPWNYDFIQQNIRFILV